MMHIVIYKAGKGEEAREAPINYAELNSNWFSLVRAMMSIRLVLAKVSRDGALRCRSFHIEFGEG
jgi:hypothetical protein